METIIIDGVEIQICKKRIRNLYIRIKPPLGKVCISAPQRMSLHDIKKFAISKMSWIIAHSKKYNQSLSQAELHYTTGDSIPFMGNRHILEVINSQKKDVQVTEGKIVLYIQENSTVEQRKKLLKSWMRKRMKQMIPAQVDTWQKIIGVQASDVGIKDMKTRWGTCNVKTKKIWLSLRLMEKAPGLLEYVIVHELVHLLEKSHNQVFKGYMDQFLPRWKTLRKELNEGL